MFLGALWIMRMQRVKKKRRKNAEDRRGKGEKNLKDCKRERDYSEVCMTSW